MIQRFLLLKLHWNIIPNYIFLACSHRLSLTSFHLQQIIVNRVTKKILDTYIQDNFYEIRQPSYISAISFKAYLYYRLSSSDFLYLA